MAAPKHWGYTREKPFTDELLVSWADGDLTKMLDKEMVERLLTHARERAVVAAYARACEDTVTPPEGERDWIVVPHRGLVEYCRDLADDSNQSVLLDATYAPSDAVVPRSSAASPGSSTASPGSSAASADSSTAGPGSSATNQGSTAGGTSRLSMLAMHVPWKTVVGGGFALALTALVVVWMLRNL
jgi:hypothetical protein